MDDVNTLVQSLAANNVAKDLKLAKGIERYLAIQQDLQITTDLAQAPGFQSRFRSFYVVRRDAEWQRVFFSFMQQHRADHPGFRETLLALSSALQRCESSFTSKLCAMLNPDLPVLDSRVLKVMQAHLPDRGVWTLLRAGDLEKRLQRATVVYDYLAAAVSAIQSTEGFAQLMQLFDRQYGRHELTSTKKLDLMLWRYGDALHKGYGGRSSDYFGHERARADISSSS